MIQLSGVKSYSSSMTMMPAFAESPGGADRNNDSSGNTGMACGSADTQQGTFQRTDAG